MYKLVDFLRLDDHRNSGTVVGYGCIVKSVCRHGNFLCGSEISLADAALYPTMVFCSFILPDFFQWEKNDVFGRRLSKWWDFMSNEVEEARTVRDGIESGLSGWKTNGRWDPILEEMKSL